MRSVFLNQGNALFHTRPHRIKLAHQDDFIIACMQRKLMTALRRGLDLNCVSFRGPGYG